MPADPFLDSVSPAELEISPPDAAPVVTRVEIGGVSLTLAQLAHIEEGHVIPLDQPVDAPVEVFVGDKLIARGQLIAMDERYAVQLTEVVA